MLYYLWIELWMSYAHLCVQFEYLINPDFDHVMWSFFSLYLFSFHLKEV